MENISATDARRSFGKLLKSIQKGPVTITRNGKQPTVILSVADYDKLMKKRTLTKVS